MDDEGGVGSSSGGGTAGGHGVRGGGVDGFGAGSGGVCDVDDITWGTGGHRQFSESIESLVRNVIQQQKIEMADEIINAGRFDQQTTHAERRETLEKIMQEQEGAAVKSCAALSMRKLNEMLAR